MLKAKLYFQTILPLIILFLFFYISLDNKSIPTSDPFGLYQDKIYQEKFNPIDFKFTESAKALGITHRHKALLPSKELNHIYPYNSLNAGVAVADFDNDGYVDLFYTNSIQNEKNFLYRNIKGEYFKLETDTRGLGDDLNTPFSSVSAAFFDYDNDGWKDLIIVKIGQHKIYKNIKGYFKDVSNETKINQFNSYSTGVKIFDFDLDGYLDIYINNFNSYQPNNSSLFYRQINETTNNNSGGGKNLFLKNIDGKYFEDISEKIGLADPGHTHDSALGDFNHDGFTDLYVANDFGRDQVYFNLNGEKFINQSDKIFKPEIRSRGSMGIDIGDIDNNGELDIYVTNITRPGLQNGLNYFWKSKHGKFYNLAWKEKVDKCGWGWGTKMLDANRDGSLDMITVNGFWNDGTKPYWYAWQTWLSLPTFLRKEVSNQPSTRGTNMATNERNCMFLNSQNNSFVDVTDKAGIDDLYDGRGLAIFDFNNDGVLDFSIANFNQPPVLYKGSYTGTNNWLGLKLISKSNRNRDLIGTTVRLDSKSGSQYRELYPTNGYNSQSDSRIYFGLKENDKFTINIVTPAGNSISLPHTELKVNKYNEINVD